MRASLKKPKPKAPTILQQQSTKLKQKLQLLREQVTQKKHQKQMNKTATSLQSASKPLSLNQTQNKLLSQTLKVNMSKQPDARLKNMLQEGKLETLDEKLKEKGIRTFERFVELTEEEVDEWKDVAVGWRIKLKKQLKLCKEKKQTDLSLNEPMAKSTQKNQSVTTQKQQSLKKYKHQEHQSFTTQKQYSPTTQNLQYRQNQKQKNIEDIIRRRKQAQIFIPICRQIQQFPYYQQQYQSSPQMTEHDQDVIIQSFMKVFQPRRGIISKESRIGVSPRKSNSPSHQKDKKVSWSRKVEQMERQNLEKNHKKYPKEVVTKWPLSLQKEENIGSSQTIPEPKPESVIKYCWKCFRKINIKENIGFFVSEQSQTQQVKYFCCQKCQSLYEKELDKLEGYLEGENDNDESLKKQTKAKYQDQQEEIETIDLSIL